MADRAAGARSPTLGVVYSVLRDRPVIGVGAEVALRRRAVTVRAGCGPRCVNRLGVAQALDVAFTVPDVM